jgi:hypothetical protein
VKTNILTRWPLPALISVLALADGVLHLMLDWILFHGNVFGAMPGPPAPPPVPAGGVVGPPPGAAPAPAPPPGHPPQLLLPLNELFLLNFVGFVVLVIVFWLSRTWPRIWRRLIDIVFICYSAASIIAWIAFGEPNPQGLGYLSKAIELILILLLIVDMLTLAGGRAAAVGEGASVR